MPTVADIAEFLQEFAPLSLAESWDNVGLLVGSGEQSVERVMTCLTITPASAHEAVRERANLIVTHHPLPFRPLKTLTDQSSEGRLLLELIGNRVAVYSPHTAFDSAAEGINARLAMGLGLRDVAPLVPAPASALGAGRHGRLERPLTLQELTTRVKKLLKLPHAQAVGDLSALVDRVGVACGSAGEFLPLAQAAGCQCLVTGEVRFHTCLEAESLGVHLVLAGHYASERFGVEELVPVLERGFPGLHAWASRDEQDPLHWL